MFGGAKHVVVNSSTRNLSRKVNQLMIHHSLSGCNATGPNCVKNTTYCDCACTTHHGGSEYHDADWIFTLYNLVDRKAEEGFCNEHGQHPCHRCIQRVRHESMQGSVSSYGAYQLQPWK